MKPQHGKSAGRGPSLPDICFTTEVKEWMYLSLGSGQVSVGHDSFCSHGRLVCSQEKSILISLLWGNRVNAWPAKCLQICETKGFRISTNFEWNISEIWNGR